RVERLAGRVLELERRGRLRRRRDRALEGRGLGRDSGTGRLLRRRRAAAAGERQRGDEGERHGWAEAMGHVLSVRGAVKARISVSYAPRCPVVRAGYRSHDGREAPRLQAKAPLQGDSRAVWR